MQSITFMHAYSIRRKSDLGKIWMNLDKFLKVLNLSLVDILRREDTYRLPDSLWSIVAKIDNENKIIKWLFFCNLWTFKLLHYKWPLGNKFPLHIFFFLQTKEKSILLPSRQSEDKGVCCIDGRWLVGLHIGCSHLKEKMAKMLMWSGWQISLPLPKISTLRFFYLATNKQTNKRQNIFIE